MSLDRLQDVALRVDDGEIYPITACAAASMAEWR